MIPLHLALLVIVMFDGQNHWTKLIIHCGEVLMIVTKKMCPVATGGVVYFKLGLNFVQGGTVEIFSCMR